MTPKTRVTPGSPATSDELKLTTSLRLTRRRLLQALGTGATLLGLDRLGLAGSEPLAAAANPDLAGGESVMGMPFSPHATVRVGIIGVGGRGTDLLGDLLAIEGVEVKAVCDIVAEKARRARSTVEKAGKPAPQEYTAGDHDFENLCRRGDLDLVYVATPWRWHVPMALAAMDGGAHAGVEVPAATTIDDCWKLVAASERARRHCMMLENCCYGYNEMLVLNMVRAGLLGDLTHAEAAYIHDLRTILFSKEGEGLWRRDEHFSRNGNLYPTHGLGPVALYLDVNRGDRFETLVSMSSLERGLSAYQKRLAQDDSRRSESYACGDINTSLIRTAKGRTIVLQHDVVSPRPYDRINLVSGTKGTFRDYPPRLFLDGQKDHRSWGSIKPHKKQFEHPLWKEAGRMARKRGGHGGMDYIMSYRLIQCMRQGLPPDLDVYDAAAWSAPGPLSEQSVAGGSVPVSFPDFTRGRWSEARRTAAASRRLEPAAV
jgi:predicted dehydrogenase